MTSLGAEAGWPAAAKYHALGVLASRSQRRLADVAGAPGVAAASAARMCDRLACKRMRRASRDHRAVPVSVTAARQKVADEAAGRQRALVAGVPGRLPAAARRAVAEAFRDFADAVGEVPGGHWSGGPVAPARARAHERP